MDLLRPRAPKMVLHNIRQYIDEANGRGGRIRTGDLLTPSQVRYQAAPRPERLSLSRGFRGLLGSRGYPESLLPPP